MVAGSSPARGAIKTTIKSNNHHRPPSSPSIVSAALWAQNWALSLLIASIPPSRVCGLCRPSSNAVTSSANASNTWRAKAELSARESAKPANAAGPPASSLPGLFQYRSRPRHRPAGNARAVNFQHAATLCFIVWAQPQISLTGFDAHLTAGVDVLADIADRGLGLPNWAGGARTAVALGRTGVWTKASLCASPIRPRPGCATLTSFAGASAAVCGRHETGQFRTPIDTPELDVPGEHIPTLIRLQRIDRSFGNLNHDPFLLSCSMLVPKSASPDW